MNNITAYGSNVIRDGQDRLGQVGGQAARPDPAGRRSQVQDLGRVGRGEWHSGGSPPKGFHDEPLKGKRQGQRSVRLNRAYRAIYVEHETGEVELIEVLEVNKHEY